MERSQNVLSRYYFNIIVKAKSLDVTLLVQRVSTLSKRLVKMPSRTCLLLPLADDYRMAFGVQEWTASTGFCRSWRTTVVVSLSLQRYIALHTLHYTTLHIITTLHYTTQYYDATLLHLHHTTLDYPTLHYTALQYIHFTNTAKLQTKIHHTTIHHIVIHHTALHWY